MGMSQELASIDRKGPTMTTSAGDLERFLKSKTALLTSFRRDGAAVGTPVMIAIEGSRAFVRTFDKAGEDEAHPSQP
jgi:hypothetical protein